MDARSIRPLVGRSAPRSRTRNLLPGNQAAQQRDIPGSSRQSKASERLVQAVREPAPGIFALVVVTASGSAALLEDRSAHVLLNRNPLQVSR